MPNIVSCFRLAKDTSLSGCPRTSTKTLISSRAACLMQPRSTPATIERSSSCFKLLMLSTKEMKLHNTLCAQLFSGLILAKPCLQNAMVLILMLIIWCRSIVKQPRGCCGPCDAVEGLPTGPTEPMMETSPMGEVHEIYIERLKAIYHSACFSQSALF